MAYSRVTVGVGGPSLSSSASGVFIQHDGGQTPATVSSMSEKGYAGLRPASGDMNQILNSTGNSSGPSVGASSFVTDANSALSGGSQLQRSPSFNNESYMRLPSSPISFSSNISGSSVMDGCSNVQQSPLQEQVQKQGLSTATSQLMQQEPSNLMNARKKPRLDIRHEDALQQQLIQQLLQRHEPVQPQDQLNLHQQAISQQQRLVYRQPQQIMHSISQMQRAPVTLQQQQQLQHQQQPTYPPANAAKQSLDNKICYRRLMQYLYHRRHRPSDNSVLYWKEFVAEYFAIQAKKRWCLSLYDNVGSHALGVFPQLAVNAWQCNICGSKSVKGFEATFEVLPRLFQIKFDHGVFDENLFLDMPHERQLSSGIVILEFKKAVQESIYEHLRIVQEGQLQIIFTPELKILFWEFCARQHEEFLPRRQLALQVDQLLQVAQRYQAAVAESSSTEVSYQYLQSSCNLFAAVGHQLARDLDLKSLNNLGFSKRYVRCLQISEVVNSMKDLIDFSQDQKIGPLESLKNYPRQVKQKWESEQVMSAHSLPGDHRSMNKVMGNHPGLNSCLINNLAASQVVNSSQQSVHALNNHQNFLKSSLNLKQNVRQQEAFLSNTSGSKHADYVQFQGSATSIPTKTSINNLSGQHQVPLPLDGCLSRQTNLQTLQVNQQLQQSVLQQMLQEMIDDKGASQQSLVASDVNANPTAEDIIGGGISGTSVRIDSGSTGNTLDLQNICRNLPNDGTLTVPSRNNSFKSSTAANNPTSSGSNLIASLEMLGSMDLPEIDHIAQELMPNGMFDEESW
ncbi:probable transcriptional regulator SLK2 isoform X1 [Musa acuminata AAA Group]|uniref:probable transcriptional regulator SLK2 isoform X1 n=1 Tax=Musa acuminata AAA Group TaxID=214697 RepID=UPI0031DB2963